MNIDESLPVRDVSVQPKWAQRAANRSKARSQDTRAHNRSLVLSSILADEGLSRADLARRTGLTRVTVSTLVDDLIQSGIVRELGSRTSSAAGKPPTRLGVDVSAFRIIGVDLSDPGGFHASVMDVAGHVESEFSLPADALGPDDVYTLVEQALSAATAPVLGIGVGSPGFISTSGTVMRAPNLRWSDVDLSGELGSRFGVPIVIANDANAAAVAEHRWGADGEDLILVRIGSGIGAGLILNGRVWHGQNFAAGEFGHVTVGTDGGPSCTCGREGCLEAWLVSTVRPAVGGALGARSFSGGERLGIALAPVVGMLDITSIVIGGTVEGIDQLIDDTRRTLEERVLSPVTRAISVREARVAHHAVQRGAATLLVERVWGLA